MSCAPLVVEEAQLASIPDIQRLACIGGGYASASGPQMARWSLPSLSPLLMTCLHCLQLQPFRTATPLDTVQYSSMSARSKMTCSGRTAADLHNRKSGNRALHLRFGE